MVLNISHRGGHKWVEPHIFSGDLDGGIILYLTLECADCDAVRTIGPANAPDGGPNDVGPMITTTYTSTDDHERASNLKERAQALAASTFASHTKGGHDASQRHPRAGFEEANGVEGGGRRL